MEITIFSVTTQSDERTPVVKRFTSLEKALEYAGTCVCESGHAALIGNESCVLED